MHILNINLSFNDYFSLNMAPKVPFEAHIIEAKRNNGILLKTPDNLIMNRNTTIGSKQYFNKPSPAKVGSNKLRVYIGFNQDRNRPTQLRADQA